MHRILLLGCLWLLLGSSLYGQSTNEKVHLKDGSILIGEILEDNEYFLRIALSNFDDTLKIGYRLILHKGELPPSKNYSQRVRRPIQVKKEGIAITAAVNFEQFGPNGDVSIWPEILLSKRIKDGKMNLGVALDYHNSSFQSSWVWQDREFFGIGGYVRYYLSGSKFRPFVDGNAGYGIGGSNQDWANEISTYTGGLAGSIGGGVHLPSRRKGSFMIRGGLDVLQTSGHIESNWNGNVVIDYKETIFSLFLGVAMEF